MRRRVGQRVPISPGDKAALRWLRNECEQYRLTQAGIGEVTGLSQPQVFRLLTGNIKTASRGARILRRYADSLRGKKTPRRAELLRLVDQIAGRSREVEMKLEALLKSLLRASHLSALSLAVAVASLLGCSSAKDDWDKRIAELCKNDGGVRIIEKVEITRAQADALGHVGQWIGVPPESNATADDAVYYTTATTVLSPGNPDVHRDEDTFVRRSDHKTVARRVYYARVGGDSPSPGHSSHFECPSFNQMHADLNHLFVVDGVQQ